MKRLLFITLLFISLAAVTHAADPYIPSNETLHYRVMYKWGLINKKAGTVTLNTHSFKDGLFKSTLIGRSAKWADAFYSVRDTLLGTIMQDKLEPVYYEKIAREGGEFKRDVIVYDRSTDSIQGDCQRWRQKKKSNEIIKSTVSIKGTGVTLDMLSSFYYMRHIDYPGMTPGESVVTNIFSGQKKETLKITYRGKQNVSIGNTEKECYYITFSFTGDNGKKSSDNMYAWISTDSSRRPLMLMGTLPVGSIRCYLEE